jgi:hypothetical protein
LRWVYEILFSAYKKTIRARTYYRVHNRKHIKTHIKPVRCMVLGCTYGCATNRDLTRHHQAKHSPDDDKEVVTCSRAGCAKQFTRLDNLGRHVKNAHGGTWKDNTQFSLLCSFRS